MRLGLLIAVLSVGCNRSAPPSPEVDALRADLAALQGVVEVLEAESRDSAQTIAALQEEVRVLSAVRPVAEGDTEEGAAEEEEGADLTAMLLQLKADQETLEELDEAVSDLEEAGGEVDTELEAIDERIEAALASIEEVETLVSELRVEVEQHAEATAGVDELLGYVTVNSQGDVVFTNTNILLRPGPGTRRGVKGQMFVMDGHDSYPYFYGK